jgi:DNA-binding CsgD family transcriptional regulator
VFVGRQRELQLFATRLQDALTGHGSVVLLAGEPGIGKTRLAEQVAELAAGLDMPCRWGRATDEEGSPPYWPLRQVLRGGNASAQAAGGPAPLELPDESLGPSQRFRLFESVAEALTAGAAPNGLLVVLDDLQWADPASLQLVVHLARAIATARLLVVATYRDTETGDREQLRRALAALGRESVVTRVRLVGLTEAEVGAHLAQLTGHPPDPAVAATVSRRTQGNPFFVAELGRLLADSDAIDAGLPGGVRDAIQERLDRLTSPCRTLLSSAAVLGSDVDPAYLAAVNAAPVGDVLAALDEAAAAGITGEPARCRFAHDLVRETARLRLPTAARMNLHLRAAEYLAGRADAASRAAELAFHYLESLPVGDPLVAANWAQRAGDVAMAQLAWEQAAELYGRALVAGAELPAADRAGLLLARARAQVLAYDVRAARESVQAAADLARGLADAELLGQAAVILEGTSDFAWAPTGRALCAEALARLPDRDTPLRARLLAQLAVDHAMVTMRDSDDDGGATLSAQALAMAERLDDHAALVAALRARQTAFGGPDGAGERLRVAERMLAIGDRTPDDQAVLWGRVWRFDALVQLGEINRAEAELDAIESAAQRLRSPLARWHLLRSRGAIAYARGRFDDALDMVVESVSMAERAGHRATLLAPLAMLAMICTQTGRTELPVYPSPADWPIGDGASGAIALWYLAIGRRSDAQRIYHGLPGPGRTPVFARLLYLNGLAELADAFDDRPMAADVHAHLTPFADLFVCSGLGALGTSGSARLPLGISAGTIGRLDEAVQQLRVAIEVNDRAGVAPFAATARFQLARMLARRRRPGDRDEAAAYAAAASSVAERLGMRPLHSKATQLTATLSGQAQGPLTTREREITALVAQGLTNRQIAATLHISERTAENHVRHILTKLGLATRTQIATWTIAARHHPLDGS